MLITSTTGRHHHRHADALAESASEPATALGTESRRQPAAEWADPNRCDGRGRWRAARGTAPPAAPAHGPPAQWQSGGNIINIRKSRLRPLNI